ncbi:hypothetical protein [Arthrobacter sp. zg-Y1110]|uniref:hypothetical protein n=1 Tax=Arthrobacter sp. zg-Y1110 TaxID=2886932 RepID=UPI001D13D281|nr:hypothetical protein [Arthrobacter sp. zg-Y1110]MCC3292518.1 hypothetical protein [Arthrobacter sp. zg-Y1110]UWX87050.1 hypothetical protein N2K99_17005 [Arthrobacter sp. zg-Y1110]
MAEGRPYVVIEADYLDEEDGIVRGKQVIAEPGTRDGQLLVTSIDGVPLAAPVAVYTHQLRPAAEGAAAA